MHGPHRPRPASGKPDKDGVHTVCGTNWAPHAFMKDLTAVVDAGLFRVVLAEVLPKQLAGVLIEAITKVTAHQSPGDSESESASESPNWS